MESLPCCSTPYWNVGRRGKVAWALGILRAAHANTNPIEPVLHCASQCWEFCYQYYFEVDLERCRALAGAAWATVIEHGISLFNSHALSNLVSVYDATSFVNCKFPGTESLAHSNVYD